MQNPPSPVLSAPIGSFRFNTTTTAFTTTTDINDNNNNHFSTSAVESPSSPSSQFSDDISLDDAPDGLNAWSHAARSKGALRMRRESEQTSASSATSTTSATYGFSIPNSNDPIDTDSPDIIPKIEELDEDGDALLSVKPGDHNAAESSPSNAVAMPRKRGRPRKHPLPIPGGQAKIAKGRSKTGCITCRRRKKKCDETKPACKKPLRGEKRVLKKRTEC
jgi:hypothetical protein